MEKHGPRVRLVTSILAIAGLVCGTAIPAFARWYTYEECELIDNRSNDGDSFHVKTKSDHYLFRLYFVDAPETDMSFSERVKEQADYWQITEAETLALGEEARTFTAEFLTGTFTVYSQRHDARGRSDMDRYFGMVEKDGHYLSEELVRRGLARVYGMFTDLPDGKKRWKYLADLRVLEREAKRNGVGGWAVAGTAAGKTEPLPEFAEKVIVLKRSVAVYSLETSPRLLGLLGRGATVRALRAESESWVRVRFNAGDDSSREGQCRRADLGL